MAEAPTPGGADALRSRLEFEAEGFDLADVDTIVASIKSGEADKRMNDVVAAIRLRVDAIHDGLIWILNDIDGLTVRQDEWTMKEARLAQRVAQTSWMLLDPVNNADHTVAVLTAVLHTRRGMTLIDAAEHAESLSALEIANAFTNEVVHLPFDGTSTPS